MKRKLLDIIIKNCEECPLFSDGFRLCKYANKEIGNLDTFPSFCPLPEAPVTKLLKITKCIDCPHCKMDNITTCITTIPPIYENHYYCDLPEGWGKRITMTEEYAKKRIADNCPLEDVE